MRPLLDRIRAGDIDPSFVITHRLTLDDALDGYRIFRDKQDECIADTRHDASRLPYEQSPSAR